MSVMALGAGSPFWSNLGFMTSEEGWARLRHEMRSKWRDAMMAPGELDVGSAVSRMLGDPEPRAIRDIARVGTALDCGTPANRYLLGGMSWNGSLAFDDNEGLAMLMEREYGNAR